MANPCTPKNHKRMLKTRLGTRTGQETLEREFKWHSNMEVRSASKSQFGTFGVPNSTLKLLNCHHVAFGPEAFG